MPCCTCWRSPQAARVRLTLDDFTRIGKRSPVLADLRPSGRYLMSELIAIGGIQPLMKMLLEGGLLHGECLTVTGHTLKQNLEKVPMYMSGQDIVRPLSDPLKKDSHLVVLYGNLAPEGAVAKITGKEGERFEGTARVFEGEERATQAILAGRVRAGDVVVIRNEGPRGGPGHARNALPDRRHHGTRAGRQGGAHYRWPLLRRQPRVRGRTYFPRKRRGRPHRSSAQRRPDHHRCPQA